MTDGYAGYDKAVRLIKEGFDRDITLAGCNAHAIRYFKDASKNWKEECSPILKIYKEIFDLEAKRKKHEKSLSEKEQVEIREQMIPLFEELKGICEEALKTSMRDSGFQKAVKYFLNQYDQLVLSTENLIVPLDNNHSEREVRPSVVGRKTLMAF